MSGISKTVAQGDWNCYQCGEICHGKYGALVRPEVQHRSRKSRLCLLAISPRRPVKIPVFTRL